MDRSLGRGGCRAGGIAYLAGLIAEHGAALEYDLVTLAGRTLDDVGGALSWRALLHFVEGLGPSSRLAREMEPTLEAASMWLDGSMTAALVADLIDVVAAFRWEHAAANVPKGKRPRKPKPVDRPWAKGSGKGEKRVGRDPIPIGEFDAWWDEKDKQTKG